MVQTASEFCKTHWNKEFTFLTDQSSKKYVYENSNAMLDTSGPLQAFSITAPVLQLELSPPQTFRMSPKVNTGAKCHINHYTRALLNSMKLPLKN